MAAKISPSLFLGMSWPEAMALGFGVLRLPPEQFWAMTPRELFAAIQGLAGVPFTGGAAAGIDRKTLNDLMQNFPDKDKRQGDR